MSSISQTVKRRDRHLSAVDSSRQTRQQAGLAPAPYFRWKGPIDRFIAAILFVPGLPVIALLALLVRLTSRGPGIYRQARVGKDGRRFMMYKIRTMRQDAEASSGPVWTKVHDPRITPLGKVLRKLHLDELPQLFNVLKGEMSLVGPRPERPEFVRVLAEAIPGYRIRLVVLPGVTGLAQVNLPPDTDITSVQRKLVLDCEYIERGGLLLDLRLMFCTFLRIFRIHEPWLLWVLRLARDIQTPTLDGAVSGNGEQSAEPAKSTPADILMRIADPSATNPPAASHSVGNGHDRSDGNEHANGANRRKHHADRTEIA